MKRRECGGVWWRGAGLTLCSAVALSGCPKGSKSTQVEVSGPKYNEKHYTGQGPLGEPPALDAAAPGAAYRIAVASTLQPRWRSFLEDCQLRLPPNHELNASDLQVVIEIVGGRNGEVVSVEILRSSANEDFDKAALEIAQDVSRLPKAPPELISDDDRVHLHWSFARDRRQAGPASAEIATVEFPVEQALTKLLATQNYAEAAQRLLEAFGQEALPQPLVEQLTSKIVDEAARASDPQLSALALQTIAGAKLTASADTARRALNSTELDVAIAAADALAVIGKESDIAVLRGFAIGNEGAKPAMSAAAAGAIVKLGSDAKLRDLATAGLDSSDPQKLGAALAVFSVLERPEVVPALSKILTGTKSSRSEKSAAAKALGKQASGTPLALKALLSGAESGDAAVRSASVSALADAARQGLRSRMAYWKMIERLKDKDERVRAGAIEAASLLDPARFAGQLSGIREGGSQLVLLSVARALQHVPGSVALARLLDLTNVEDASVREAATTSLLAHDSDEARARLGQLMDDESLDVRLAALPSLSAAPGLEPLLDDKAEEMRGAAMRALVALQGRDASSGLVVSKLASAQGQPSLALRWASAWLLGT